MGRLYFFPTNLRVFNILRFEFRALEVALESICSFLAARTTELETAAYPALDELTSSVCNFFTFGSLPYFECLEFQLLSRTAEIRNSFCECSNIGLKPMNSSLFLSLQMIQGVCKGKCLTSCILHWAAFLIG